MASDLNSIGTFTSMMLVSLSIVGEQNFIYSFDKSFDAANVGDIQIMNVYMYACTNERLKRFHLVKMQMEFTFTSYL